MRFGVVGVPYNSAGLAGGEARAPAALRAAGLIAALDQVADVRDYGDVPFGLPHPRRDPLTGIIAPDSLVTMVEAVRTAVDDVLAGGRLPLVIGGECPLVLGCLAAARDTFGRVGLLFVDGHEDAWPPHRSTTGEAADMELGLALGLTRADGLDALQALLPLVSPAATVVLGPRDKAELAAAGVPAIAPHVTFLDDRSLLAADIATTVSPLIRRLSLDPGHWWFHFDLDALSTASLAAVRYPQPGGLDWSDAESIAAIALRTPGLVGWNITIYNPDLDQDGQGARRIVSFVQTVIQAQRLAAS